MSLSLKLAEASYQLAETLGVDESLSKTEQFMRANNLESLLPKVQEKLTLLCDTEIERGKISVTTAAPLSDDVRKNIGQAHDAADADITETVDPSLLAGFISQYKGQAIDTSIQTIISKLHN